MVDHLANTSSDSGGFRILRNMLRVNGSRKFGTRPNPHQARPGNSKLNRTNSRRIHTVPIHHIFQQNARGLKSQSALTEIIDSMRCRKGFSLGLQETLRVGKEEFTENKYTFLGSGHDAQHGRGSCGVGILLSPAATTTWKASGPSSLHNDFVPRVVVARMPVLDHTTGTPIGILMIYAYLPSSDASEHDQLDFQNVISSAISRRYFGDILVICADANASIGKSGYKRNDANIYTIVGLYGINLVILSGGRLQIFLEIHNLSSLSSFFKKRYYGT